MIFSVSLEDVVLMQFTGLFDKNGKQIFEGDIIKNEYNEMSDVRFDNGRFYYNKGINWGEIDSESVEVIGNIWENPELVK